MGVAGLVECFGRFALKGHGTPAPIAPPENLVVSGLYRHVRNPMYVAVVCSIVGQALLFGSVVLLEYAGVVWLLFHVFVLGYEEPTLRQQFGSSYAAYRANVRRWWPRLTPWQAPAQNDRPSARGISNVAEQPDEADERPDSAPRSTGGRGCARAFAHRALAAYPARSAKGIVIWPIRDRSSSPGQPGNSGRWGERCAACSSIAGSRFAPWCAAKTTGRQLYGPSGRRWWSETYSNRPTSIGSSAAVGGSTSACPCLPGTWRRRSPWRWSPGKSGWTPWSTSRR